ncbi:MAG: alanine racemase [Limnobacter sp.]|nr:alanine racemase [Limnobacter sp.]
MPRPIHCQIDPAAIDHNIGVLKKLNPAAHLMAVVKANGYGHGLKWIQPGLQAADSLALLEIENAERLRAQGWTKPIMLLEGFFDEEDLTKALDIGCDLTVHTAGQLEALHAHSHWLSRSSFKPRLYLKINTGMNRLGVPYEQASDSIEKVQALVTEHDLPVPVMMTHFANADADDPSRTVLTPQEQYDRLYSILPGGWQTCLANSAGALNWPDLAGQIIRPGISIYGATPGPKTAREYGLCAAMTLSSEVISIQTLKAGQAVGYGSRYIAQTDQKVAIVACGYADGYPRHAPDGTPVWVAGKVCPLAGRVSMDMLTVDVTGHPNVNIGDRVELWGQHVPVDAVAKASGTIGYELMCAVANRVPFSVTHGGQA